MTPHEKRTASGGESGGPRVRLAGDTQIVPPVVPTSVTDDCEHMAMRLLQECLTNATRAYWERRALTLEAARPRVGDFHGKATRQELSEQWQRLTEAASACRARASVTEASAELEEDVVNVWREVSAA